MKFINRHVIYQAGIVLAATLLLYWAMIKLPGSSLLSAVGVAYILTVILSTILNHRADQYQGFFGFNYHLITYIICVGVPLLLRWAGLLTDAGFVSSMAATWGIGLAIHLIVLLILFRKRKIGNYDKREIFD